MSLNDSNSEVYGLYKDALLDLTSNLKPLINSLTMFADDYKSNSRDVVRAIEEYIEQSPTERKLLGLYLMDSIIKNLKESNYVPLFQEIIVQLFANVFEQVDEANRKCLYKLRQTWPNIFSARVLYSIDIAVNNIDPAWPIINASNTSVSNRIVAPPQSSLKPTSPKQQQQQTEQHTSPQKVLLEVNERKKKLEDQQSSQKKQLTAVVAARPQSTAVVVKPQLKQAPPSHLKSLITMPTVEMEATKVLTAAKPKQTVVVVNGGGVAGGSRQATVVRSASSEMIRAATSDSRDPRLLKQTATSTTSSRPSQVVAQKVSPLVKKTVSPTVVTKTSPPKPTTTTATKTSPASSINKKPVKRASPVPSNHQDYVKKAKMSNHETPAVRSAPKASVEKQATGKQPSAAPRTTKLISPPLTAVVQKGKKVEKKPPNDLGELFGSGDIDYRSKEAAAAAATAPKTLESAESQVLVEHMETNSNLTEPHLFNEIGKLLVSDTTNNTGGIVDVIKNLLMASSTAQPVSHQSIDALTVPATTSTEAAPSIEPLGMSSVAQSLAPPQNKPMPLMSSTIPAPAKPLMFLDIPPAAQTASSINHGYATYIPPIKPRDKHEQEDSLVVIDGRSYRIQPDQRRIIKIYYHDHELYCDTKTKDVYIDTKRVYRMGDTTKEVMLNGRKVRLMYMGKRIELWINGVSFHFRADSPPKQIFITSPVTGFSKCYYVTIDGRTMDILLNHYKVCNLNAGLRNRELVQTVKLAADDFETYEIAYMCPPKRIMIDDQPRIMRYDLPIPCVEIDGHFYVIRFSGTSRSIMIDDMTYEVPFDGVKRIRLYNNNNNRAHELAWGGPGFEVIIDGRPYELQFGQTQPREVYIGANKHYIRVLGEPPDVKICGRLPEEILRQHEEELGEDERNEEGRRMQSSASLNVNELLEQLMKHNIIPKAPDADTANGNFTTSGSIQPSQNDEPVPDLTNLDGDLLKKKYSQAIQNLYGGVQCSTCGMRFVNTNSKRFSNHYDWHFRQNKREKEEINIAHSRNWYYDVPEWIEYEELSEEDQAQQLHQQIDGDQRQLSTQQSESNVSYSLSNNHHNQNDNSNSDLNSTNVQLNTTLSNKASTCPASDDIDDNCFICKDPFDIFWDEDKEEWFFKDAVRVGNKVYHPVCYDDVTEDNVSLLSATSVPSTPVIHTVSASSLFNNNHTETNSHVNTNHEISILNDTIETDNQQQQEGCGGGESSLKDEPSTP